MSNRFGTTVVISAFLFFHGTTYGGVDANAGLVGSPRWTHTDQLKPTWGKLSTAELMAAANKGEAEAQHYLGWCFSNGTGVEMDIAKAATWFQKAADQNFALSQHNLGILYHNGQGVSKDPQRAAQLLRSAANQGLPVSLQVLGRLANDGKLDGSQPGDAARFLELAAEQGDCEAAVQLGVLYTWWGPKPSKKLDFELAAYWFSFAARNGCAQAYRYLGLMYVDGPGIRDSAEALKWFEKGVSAGDPNAFYSIAMYELVQNEHTPNLENVRKWLLVAADKRVTNAYYQLGRVCELRDISHPPSAKPDYEEAAKWYRKAAESGNAAAGTRLKELAQEGKIRGAQ